MPPEVLTGEPLDCVGADDGVCRPPELLDELLLELPAEPEPELVPVEPELVFVLADPEGLCEDEELEELE